MSTIRHSLARLLSASALTTLTACADFTDVAVPPLPAETVGLRACTSEAVPGIPGKKGDPIVKGDVAGIIGDQRTSALQKDKCSHDWETFYDGLLPAYLPPTDDSLWSRIKGLVPR